MKSEHFHGFSKNISLLWLARDIVWRVYGRQLITKSWHRSHSDWFSTFLHSHTLRHVASFCVLITLPLAFTYLFFHYWINPTSQYIALFCVGHIDVIRKLIPNRKQSPFLKPYWGATAEETVPQQIYYFEFWLQKKSKCYFTESIDVKKFILKNHLIYLDYKHMI